MNIIKIFILLVVISAVIGIGDAFSCNVDDFKLEDGIGTCKSN